MARAIARYLLAGLFLSSLAFSQTQAINGSVRGRIVDSTGAAVPKASVAVAEASTGFTRTVETNDDGYYVVPNLPLGVYSVTVKKQGFDTERHTGIVLNAGTEADINAQLKVGAVSTTVEVTGGAPVLEASRVSTGLTIDHDEVDNLPLTLLIDRNGIVRYVLRDYSAKSDDLYLQQLRTLLNE